jgi:hypothetical protein
MTQSPITPPKTSPSPIPTISVPLTKEDTGWVSTLLVLLITVIPLIRLAVPFVDWLSRYGSVVFSQPFLTIPGLILGLLKEKRYPWGVVYDSRNKEPLDPVLITLEGNGTEVQAISDIYGRYQFLVEPGAYQMNFSKSNYKFPSQVALGKEKDGPFEDLYFGGELNYEESGKVMNAVPMDPTGSDWNQEEKRQLRLYLQSKHLIKYSNALFFIGLPWSIVATALSPSLLNTFIMALYVTVAVLFGYKRLNRPWGVVQDSEGKAVEGAVVRLINMKFPTLFRSPLITKKDGHYSFLVEEGEYQVVVELHEGEEVREVYRSKPLKITSAADHIGFDIRLG